MPTNLVSVVVPIYKVEKYLGRCVESIRNQTYSNIEIVLVDDGSPDNCPSMCDEWAKKDARVKTIHKSNGGLSSARNAGIDASSGDYIALIDGDDYIHPEMIERMMNAIIGVQADFCICNAKSVKDDGTPYPDPVHHRIKSEVLDGDKKFEVLRRDAFGCYVTAWNKLYSRAIFDKVRFPEGRIHEDEFTIHRFFDAARKIVCIEDELYFYVQRDGSIMHTTFGLKKLDSVDARIERALFFKEKGLYKNYVFAARQAYGALVYCLKNLDVYKYRRVLNGYRKAVTKLLRIDLRVMKLNFFYYSYLWKTKKSRSSRA